MRIKRWLDCLCVVSLLACGGEGDNSAQVNELRAQAGAKEAEARLLGADEPCTVNDQCAVLLFSDTVHRCDPGGRLQDKYYKVYSLTSTTADQAKQAADMQNELAAQARSLQPAPEGLCPAVSSVLLGPVCEAGKCVIPAGP
jgi:hypothetical protein